MEVLKVSAHSRSTAVAGAIAGIIRGGTPVHLQAIGAGAVNQAIKAVAIARNYLLQDKIDIMCMPSFVEIEINGQMRTALKIFVDQLPNGMHNA